jgi:hypothetical protein
LKAVGTPPPPPTYISRLVHVLQRFFYIFAYNLLQGPKV